MALRVRANFVLPILLGGPYFERKIKKLNTIYSKRFLISSQQLN